jgi:lipoic acid synthetase
MPISKQGSLPKIRLPYDNRGYEKIVGILEEKRIHTVCQEANCPNIFRCFSKNALTFMILGNICTRNCLYCNVKTGKPFPPDRSEAVKIADIIGRLGLDYVVITCVTRDDLDDGGASVFAETVREIRNRNAGCKIEVLVSDLNGDGEALKKITDSNPQVIGHNAEVARRLFPVLRPQGNYEKTLKILKSIKKHNSEIVTKSGFMVGLGENEKEIIRTMKDIRNANCDIITIGQYLAPSLKHAPVRKFYSEDEFSFLEETGKSMGFKCVQSGPLVRSSFDAKASYEKARRKT